MSKYTLKGSVSVHGIHPGGKFVAGQVIEARDYSPQLIKHLHMLDLLEPLKKQRPDKEPDAGAQNAGS